MTKHINIDTILSDCMDIDWNVADNRENKVYLAAKQQICDLILEIIGEPEYRETLDMGLSSWTNDDFKAFGRNELRNEQRQKLTNLFKGGE